MLKLSTLFTALGVALLAAWPAAAQTGPAAAPAPAVGVITAAPRPVYNQQSYVGRIQSPRIVALNARVTGFLEQQNFRDGDSVTRGQLLYMIEQPPYQAAVAQAQAAVDQARANAHNANLTLGRAQALLNTPAGLPSNVDTSRAAAVSGGAQIDSALAQLQTAQINLGYTQIRAPIDGRISATNVDVGNVVGPGSGVLATIVSEDPVYVSFALPVLDALNLRAAARGGLGAVAVLVQLPDGRIYDQTSSIDFVNNQIAQATDTLAMRATIANPPLPGMSNAETDQRELSDGEFINVILRDKTPKSEIVLPPAAVITDQLGAYVFTVDGQDVAHRQAVTTGQATADSVVILTGLKAGDQVVLDGIQRVKPDTKVNPKPGQPTATAKS